MIRITIVYYAEVNLICISILALFARQRRFRSDRSSADNRVFSLMLAVSILLCASDMIAGIARGHSFPGARTLIVVSNTLYFEAISVVCYLWLLYVLIRLKIMKRHIRGPLLCSTSLLAISIVTLTNPWTNFLFSVDADNRYVRGDGVWVHWAVSWSYLLITTGITLGVLLQKKNRHKWRKLHSLLFFIIPPAVSAVVQMFFYGISCFQVGITLSIAMVSVMEQNAQISTDSLTNLNNRYGLNRYWENHTPHGAIPQLCVMMIDIDNFKQVNDRFGHLEGDRALTDVAYVVRRCCEKTLPQAFVCRYGGDEFLVIGREYNREDMERLAVQIQQRLERENQTKQYPYHLSVSIGIADGVCKEPEDMERLFQKADDVMYRTKTKKREKLWPSKWHMAGAGDFSENGGSEENFS